MIKPTRCTDFSKFIFGKNSTCFGQFLCPSSGLFHCTHSNGICHTGLLTACKHVEFFPKINFEKSVHLVGFIIRIYHDARSPERQIHTHIDMQSRNRTGQTLPVLCLLSIMAPYSDDTRSEYLLNRL